MDKKRASDMVQDMIDGSATYYSPSLRTTVCMRPTAAAVWEAEIVTNGKVRTVRDRHFKATNERDNSASGAAYQALMQADDWQVSYNED